MCETVGSAHWVEVRLPNEVGGGGRQGSAPRDEVPGTSDVVTGCLNGHDRIRSIFTLDYASILRRYKDADAGAWCVNSRTGYHGRTDRSVGHVEVKIWRREMVHRRGVDS